MKLTVLGCSGSLAAPGNPASGYLVTRGEDALVLDLGPGALAALQQVHSPSNVHIAFTHLHADHCLDFPSLMVWRRYHPSDAAKEKHLCLGPSYTEAHLGRLSAESPDQVDDMSDTFVFEPWEEGKPQRVGGFEVTPFSVVHPVEAYALRVADPETGHTLVYSGDTSYTENLVEAARGADVLLCEASWGPGGENQPPQMHMSGPEAGQVAREAGVGTLILTHIPPWVDPEATLEATRQTFDGHIVMAKQGLIHEL